MSNLKRGDAVLIQKAIESNGGGIRIDIIPRAQLLRLLKLEALRWKPNKSGYGCRGMVIHGTKARRILNDEKNLA